VLVHYPADRGLVDGRWELLKESYAVYAERARAWTSGSELVRGLMAAEDAKLALTRAAESFLRQPASLVIVDDQPAVASGARSRLPRSSSDSLLRARCRARQTSVT
jgi:hypothetical protein